MKSTLREEVEKLCDMSESIKFNYQDPSPTKPSLRKITSADSFPCYGCGNDRILIRDCDICGKTGFLDGGNPMVRLIEKIIDSKMDSGAGGSIREMDIRFSTERDLTSSVVFPIEMNENFVCDECEADIKGKRYHCATCGDYDLCAACYVKSAHQHKLAEVREDPKKTQLDRQTQRSTLMKSCRMSINRDSQL